MAKPPGVLFVCTGNLCRSPMAEQLLRAGLRARFGEGPDLVGISSAGTQAVAGRAMWPPAQAELTRRGLPPDRFTTRPLRRDSVLGSDLVLTATRTHRDDVVTLAPEALGRVFTWREIASLLHGVGVDDVPGVTPAERLRALPALAAGRRGVVASPPSESLDVADPMGGGAEDFRRAAAETAEAIRVLVDLL